MNYQRICLLLITISLLVITFTLGLPKSTLELVQEGYDLYKKARYEDAIKVYNEALKQQPESSEIYLATGKCYHKLGDYEHAIKCYDKAIEFNREHLYSVYYNKGKAYLDLRDYREAIDCFDEALKLKPENLEAKNRKEEAEKALKNQLYGTNNLPVPGVSEKSVEYYNTGLINYNKGRYNEAITWFDEALKLDPLYEEAKCKKIEAERRINSVKHHYTSSIVPLPEMVSIDGGRFQMGSTFWPNEQPIHSVTLSSFNMGKYTVTNMEYCRFLNFQGNQTESGVTWAKIVEDKWCGINGGPPIPVLLQ